MRLKSELWVKAFLRRCEIGGASAVMMRRGNRDAGAIYIVVDWLDGTASLYGPAPAGLDVSDQERRFVRLLDAERADRADVVAYLEKEASFDSDLWVVEVEDRKGRHFLDGWLQG